MSSSQINSARGRRARSAEDESPVIVAAIAVLAVVVLSCVGMLAPVLWTRSWAARGCARVSKLAAEEPSPQAPRDARTMPDFNRSGRTRGRNSVRLFRTYEIGSGSLSNSYAPVSTFPASNERPAAPTQSAAAAALGRMTCSF